jgi:hypothetical protein
MGSGASVGGKGALGKYFDRNRSGGFAQFPRGVETLTNINFL